LAAKISGREAGEKHHAAVNEQGRPSHVVGSIRHQPSDNLGDIVWLAYALVGNQGHQAFVGSPVSQAGWLIGVRMAPGATPFTRIASGATSCAMLRVIPFDAA